jgi:hypothetical protein
VIALLIALLKKKRGRGEDSEENVTVLKHVKRCRSTGHDVGHSCNQLDDSCHELDHSDYTMLAFQHVERQLLIHARDACNARLPIYCVQGRTFSAPAV